MDPLDSYSPARKNQLEIDKLHEELNELRSRLRRWLGSLAGLLGIVTTAVGIIVTSNQLTKAAGEANRKENELSLQRSEHKAELAKFEAERAAFNQAKAEAKLAEAVKNEMQTTERVKAKNDELAALEKQYADIQTKAGESQSAKEKLTAELEKANSDLQRIQNETAQLAVKLKSQPNTQKEAATATAIADSTRNLIASEHARLVDDNKNARLFVFALDTEQKENAWKLEKPLKEAGFFIGNVLIFGGKREDTPVLRYFRDQDRKEAEKIKDALAAQGLEQIRVSRVNDPDSAGSGRKYQLWVRKENLRDVTPETASSKKLSFTVTQYSIVSKPLTPGKWLSVYVANPNDDDPFRCVVFMSAKDETSEEGKWREFPAPAGTLFDQSLLPDKTLQKSGRPPFEKTVTSGRIRVSIPDSSFRKATLEITWTPK